MCINYLCVQTNRSSTSGGAVPLGALLVAFLNRVSHPRGRALTFLAKSGVTVDQAILLNAALEQPGSTPTALATKMSLSLPSISQMLERLAKLDLVRRLEDSEDRRRKVIEVTPKARRWLAKLHDVRSAEFVTGTSALSPSTRVALAAALTAALGELSTSSHTEQER